jgi:very-short-patch-repair endonuclease
MTQSRSPRAIVANARYLRRNMTDAEQAVWRVVRDKQLQGYRFRRQRPMGKYIADFVCLEAKLVIEVDGGQHADHADYDAARTAFLVKLGFRVLRFWNNDVLQNLGGVTETILTNLTGPPQGSQPHPNPPLLRGGS